MKSKETNEINLKDDGGLNQVGQRGLVWSLGFQLWVLRQAIKQLLERIIKCRN